MTKHKQISKSPHDQQDKPQVVHIMEYEITREPIIDESYKKLPEQIKDDIERLHYEAQYQPQEAIPELRRLIKQYPHILQLYNFLAAAYNHAGKVEKAKEIAQANYDRNPDYLFSRINHAQFCLNDGEYDKVAEIFDHKFDLGLLYPNRKRFHISEVTNFMGFMGLYFLEIGKREQAELYYETLDQIAPDFPITNVLRDKLYPKLLKGFLRQARNASK
jgi:tetratricopeptide (TPR) repeat protein